MVILLDVNMPGMDGFKTAVNAGVTLSGQFSVVRHDGSTFTALVTNSPIRDEESGAMSGLIAVAKDITDLTSAQELLARAAAQQTAVAALGRYALAADDIASVARAAESTITGILGPDEWHARVHWLSEPAASTPCPTCLRGALDNGEIKPHYQPIIDLGTGRVVGVEALARWRRPSGERVAPDSFIGLAEEIGLIEPLGQHILLTACRHALVWCHASPDPFVL